MAICQKCGVIIDKMIFKTGNTCTPCKTEYHREYTRKWLKTKNKKNDSTNKKSL